MPPSALPQKHVGSKLPPFLGPIGVITGLIAISFIVFAYERALVPLYGSGPTTFLLNKIVSATVLVASIYPIKPPTARSWLYAAISLSLAPNATYWVAVLTSRRRDPILGPAITHLAVLVPLVYFLTTSIMGSHLQPVSRRENELRSPIIYRLTMGGACFIAAIILPPYLWANLSYLNNISESQIFLSLASVVWVLWILNYPLSENFQPQNKKNTVTETQTKAIMVTVFIALWWTNHQTMTSPVLPHPLKETYTHHTAPLQIHASVQSTTGLIVVGEALPPPDYAGEDDQVMHSVRYLRASHSILGGVWMGAKVNALDDEPPVLDSFGTPLGDSIYSTFVLQEAARLVNSTDQGKTGSWKNALIIGLGTGISATAFSRHGIPTTIVEIDAAVYDAARTFFGLPDPGPDRIFLEDARTWATKKRENVQSGNRETLYDIVIHDCFSGGGVPDQLFTMEFWSDLKTVLHPEGVVVVNFAGILKTDASRMVLHTLERSFKQCRAFHDHFGELTDDKYEKVFINMVLFCTSSTAPLTFRKARKTDYLGSPLRRHVLSSLPTREVKLDLIRDPSDLEGRYILTDSHNPLGKFQREQGHHHWKLMREVLPDVHWETY